VCAGLPALPSAGAAEPEIQAPPRVVVLLVVDQLRADLLDRYDAVFTEGFRRLRDKGYRFTQTTHDHGITYTAPGHATLATGVTPRKHGVVSNAWFQVEEGGWVLVDNVVDDRAPLVEGPTVAGASPRVLEREGVADWLQAAHPEARVVSVSAKSRAAVLMASHSQAQVYWFEEALGRFASSVHYMETYPDWFTAFNQEVLPTFAADTIWELTVPARFRTLAWRDSAAHEGDGVHTAFPHAFSQSEFLYGEGAFWTWWAGTPRLDRATRLLAQAAAEAEGIGDDDIPDLLAVSFSQTDRVGHAYGPRSLEQLDNLFRLDRELGEFLAWLDRRHGPDGYVVLLTADHGILDSPEVIRAEGGWGLRIPRDSAFALQRVMNAAAGEVGVQDPERLARGLAARVPAVSWVEQAWTFASLNAAVPAHADSFTVMQARSTFPGRYTGVMGRQGLELRFRENPLLWTYPRGSTHGSPYLYDRHVPFVLFGAGIAPGASDVRASANDAAPTLAAILGVPIPDDLDGVARRAGEGGGGL
ncbi:MAG TPA: alkaline phosphatase family protein, partial [Longimicrobiales bacterium]|nr:alkaline phosphatase family protein [Longimicrobiales bacterium]